MTCPLNVALDAILGFELIKRALAEAVLAAHLGRSHPGFLQQIFDIPKRQGKADIHHDSQSNDLRAGLEITKWRSLGHAQTLAKPPARLKAGFF